MRRTNGTKSTKVASKNSLYHGAKISEYRFRRVLEQFVLDSSATDAASATGLSVNSVHAIYRKLRVFFFEVGLFLDFYADQDPLEFVSDNPVHEQQLITFHLERIRDRRGLRSPSNEPPYHFAESCWRYDFKVLMEERPSQSVQAMMLAHLLELIRLCGPIGGSPKNRVEGLEAVSRQIDQRILWLERNAPGFANIETRAALKSARDIQPDQP